MHKFKNQLLNINIFYQDFTITWFLMSQPCSNWAFLTAENPLESKNCLKFVVLSIYSIKVVEFFREIEAKKSNKGLDSRPRSEALKRSNRSLANRRVAHQKLPKTKRFESVNSK